MPLETKKKMVVARVPVRSSSVLGKEIYSL
jgi:hypothetical protein